MAVRDKDAAARLPVCLRRGDESAATCQLPDPLAFHSQQVTPRALCRRRSGAVDVICSGDAETKRGREERSPEHFSPCFAPQPSSARCSCTHGARPDPLGLCPAELPGAKRGEAHSRGLGSCCATGATTNTYSYSTKTHPGRGSRAGTIWPFCIFLFPVLPFQAVLQPSPSREGFCNLCSLLRCALQDRQPRDDSWV